MMDIDQMKRLNDLTPVGPTPTMAHTNRPHVQRAALTEIRAFGYRFDRYLKKHLKAHNNELDDGELAAIISRGINSVFTLTP